VDFINKHYEKLILLGMLLFFIFAMINVLSIASQTSEVKDSDLKIPTRQPDFEPEADKAKYSVSAIRREGTYIWQKGVARSKQASSGFYSDLTEFPGLAVCLPGKDDSGNESGCGMMVPRSVFSGKPCPNCGRILPTPPARPKMRRNVITPDDSDGDGISNTDEEKYRLDKLNPHDALYDADSDGFSNIYEIENKTDPTIARQHPPYWTLLRIVAVRREELPIRLKSINTNRSNDPKRWDIQLNVDLKRNDGSTRTRTELARLNGTVKIENRTYKIVKIERVLADSSGKSVKKEEFVAGGVMQGTGDKAQDLSKIYLEEVLDYKQKQRGDKPDKLEMQVLKPVYSSDRRPVLENMGAPEGKRQSKAYRVGEQIVMGSRRSGISTYVLHSFDEKKMTAVLERTRVSGKQDPGKDELGNVMIVTRESKVPDDSWVIEQVITGSGMQDEQVVSGKKTAPQRRR
jgi:hypothetical protein